MRPTLKKRVRLALAERFRVTCPGVALDQKGYVSRVEDNLLPNIDVGLVRQAFGGAAGHELKSKMRAVHSSSALVVNAFAPWMGDLHHLHLAGSEGFNVLEFEAHRLLGFYIWKVMIPLVLIVFMSWTVFWIDPVHVAAQIGVATTSMLTFIAY